MPSDFVPRAEAEACAAAGRFGVRVHGAGEYPPQLHDAAHPVALLYYPGLVGPGGVAGGGHAAAVGGRASAHPAPGAGAGGGRLHGGVGAGGGHRPHGV